MTGGERGARIFFLFLLAWSPLFFFLAALPARAGEGARVEEMAVINSERYLLLYLSVRDALSPEMKEGVKNGIPVTFHFFVELYRERNGSKERQIVSRSFEHTMIYDSLKEEFTVEMEEHGGLSLSFPSLEEAGGAMNNVRDFRLAELSTLERGGDYVVMARARLAKKNLPLNFQYIMPFWHLWTFETDWKSLSFTYGNPGSAAR